MKDGLHVSLDTLGREAGMYTGSQTHMRRGSEPLDAAWGRQSSPEIHKHTHTHTHTPRKAEMVLFAYW